MAGITAAVIGAGTAIYSANRQKKAQSEATKAAQSAQKAADPYAQYREGAASQLNALSQNGYTPNLTGINQGLTGLQNATNAAGAPLDLQNQISRGDLYAPERFTAGNTSVGSLNDFVGPYKDVILQASLQGAQRQSAAQGYTGSGNALVAAAQAGRESAMYSYQLAGIDQESARASAIAGAQLGMQANQLYAQQLMNANDNALQLSALGLQQGELSLKQRALGMEGANQYLNAMYKNEGMLQEAYNNRFNQLAMLSGADVGINAAAGVSGAVSTGIQNQGQAAANQANAIGSGIAGIIGAFGK